MANSKLMIEEVRTALDYNPETGLLLWREPQSNRVKIGDRAGVIAQNGRRYINIGGEKHLAHRLAWFHFYGEWPSGDVRQKNENYDDCRIENLYEQTRRESASTRRLSASSKSGHAGVTWDTKRGKWQVHITRDYKQVFIGLFDDLDAAVAARQHAQETWISDVSAEDRDKAAHIVMRRRRQRAAWSRVNAKGTTGWLSFDDFCADIGDIPQTRNEIVAVDGGRPVGPGNFKWSLPPEKKNDFKSREGRIAYNKAHRAENPDLYRDKELRRNFNITLADYREKLAEQGGVCAICGGNEVAEKNGKKLALAVDHNHETNELRGILCVSCNTAIGKLKDSPEIMRRAASYLRKYGVDDVAPNPLYLSIADAMARSPHRDWLAVSSRSLAHG